MGTITALRLRVWTRTSCPRLAQRHTAKAGRQDAKVKGTLLAREEPGLLRCTAVLSACGENSELRVCEETCLGEGQQKNSAGDSRKNLAFT